MKKLIMMVGLPRSGKSTRAKELSKELNAPIVEPDAIHKVLHGTPYREEANPMVWGLAKTMVRALFETGYDIVIVDACNNTHSRRLEWKDWSREIWYRDYVVIDTSHEECHRRDGEAYPGARPHGPLHEVIDRMAAKHEPVDESDYDPVGL